MPANSFMGVHYGVWAAVSALIAVVYYFVWPRPVNNINSRPLGRHLILRYGHTLVWLIMSLSFLMRLAFTTRAGETTADITAMLAFVLYLVFLVTATIDKRASS